MTASFWQPLISVVAFFVGAFVCRLAGWKRASVGVQAAMTPSRVRNRYGRSLTRHLADVITSADIDPRPTVGRSREARAQRPPTQIDGSPRRASMGLVEDAKPWSRVVGLRNGLYAGWPMAGRMCSK